LPTTFFNCPLSAWFCSRSCWFIVSSFCNRSSTVSDGPLGACAMAIEPRTMRSWETTSKVPTEIRGDRIRDVLSIYSIG